MSQDSSPDEEFSNFLSSVASRLRHDLKGGLITLKMGLEALPEGEELKPLLLERTEQLVGLSDKLVILLRMGQMSPRPTRLSALLGEFRSQTRDRFPGLTVDLPTDLVVERPEVDGDALIFALLELAENAQLAGATALSLRTEASSGGFILEVCDNGEGVLASDTTESLSILGYSRWERSGLGLSIVRRCAKGHGGDLDLARGAQGGTRAFLKLGAV